MIILIMGVSGSGKSTIGAALAHALGCGFTDADSLHSSANRVKMAAGVALTDEDRQPWLTAIRAEIDRARAAGDDHVFACSALRQVYRDRLDPDHSCRLVYLRGGAKLLAERLEHRTGHFFSKTGLRGQLDILEEPEQSIVLDIRDPPEKLVQNLLRLLRP